MAARSIASLSLSFGLVNIPVRLFSATESGAAIRFNLLAKDGSRVKQQYISEKDQKVVARADMVKGYEFEKDQFVIFKPEELKALEEGGDPAVEIVAFIPDKAVDPIFFDKAYLLAPDKRGAKPYSLLMEAMRKSGRCALAKWAWKTRQHVVQVRVADGGLVLQQLLYADEVRSPRDLDIELAPVADAELELALRLIEQIAQDDYDPSQFEDEEKKRILAAIDEKIEGKEVVAAERGEPATTGNVIDMMEALRASLGKRPAAKGGSGAATGAKATGASKARKGVQRARKVTEQPARARARK